jgi:hypothetical protein
MHSTNPAAGTAPDQAVATQFKVEELEPRFEVAACYDNDKKIEDDAALLYNF